MSQCRNQRSGWPMWATMVAVARTTEDRGVGDTVKRIASIVGAERFEQIAANLGMPCHCTKRQSKWNKMYPYA